MVVHADGHRNHGTTDQPTSRQGANHGDKAATMHRVFSNKAHVVAAYSPRLCMYGVVSCTMMRIVCVLSFGVADWLLLHSLWALVGKGYSAWEGRPLAHCSCGALEAERDGSQIQRQEDRPFVLHACTVTEQAFRAAHMLATTKPHQKGHIASENAWNVYRRMCIACCLFQNVASCQQHQLSRFSNAISV